MAARGSLLSRLRDCVDAGPDELAFSFLEDGETEERVLTRAELTTRARGVALRLLEAGPPGSRALLVYAPGPSYLIALLGCIYAGWIAVPAYPPDLRRIEQAIERLGTILTVSRADAILCDTSTAELVGTLRALLPPEFPDTPWVATSDIAPTTEALPEHATSANTPLILQFTSGSTSRPRGVVLTNATVLANIAAIEAAFGIAQGPKRTMVSWLPPYHDMGLIGGLLTPVVVGVRAVVFSPFDFIRAPARWLRAITHYRAEYSGGPNSSFDLCVRRVTEEERAGLDLSSWRIAWNGAEPVRAETIDAFTAAFASVGFRREAFYPCYGLAEATLIVTGPQGIPRARTIEVSDAALRDHRVRPPASEQDVRRAVSVGRPVVDTEVAIVDAATSARSAEGHVGEIWVRGAGISPGYFEDADRTEETFGGRLDGKDHWLRTGDLGFVSDGELFVTGRLKDLVVIRGKNYYPQDIERAVELSYGSIRRGCVIAFGDDSSGEEELVLVAEVERRAQTAARPPSRDRRQSEPVEPSEPTVPAFDPTKIIAEVRCAAFEATGLRVKEVVLVIPGTMPKTSSGKLQRLDCRQRYRQHQLSVVNRG